MKPTLMLILLLRVGHHGSARREWKAFFFSGAPVGKRSKKWEDGIAKAGLKEP